MSTNYTMVTGLVPGPLQLRKKAIMQPYLSRKASTGVRAFALHATSIDVEFQDGSRYRYDYTRPGPEKVERMKQLALEGEGLTTFINQHVREDYVRRLSRSARA